MPESNNFTGISSFLLVQTDMAVNISSSELTPQQSGIINRVLTAALEAVDPRLAVQHALVLQDQKLILSNGQSIDLFETRRIRLVGVGKAAQAMAQGVLDQLGERITEGLIITKHRLGSEVPLPERIRVLLGGHPVPSEESVQSTLALANFLQDGTPEDLVICLISGGGSALMTLPVEGTNLREIQELTRLLLGCGATIGEMNTLRKHLDRAKGGGLARMAAPARLVVLILSDVIGSPLDVIASGPAVADPTTYDLSIEILEKYNFTGQTPPGILAVLREGQAGRWIETVKPGDPLLENVITQVIASNVQAAGAALTRAREEGMNTLLLTNYLQGEASQAGIFLSGLLRQIQETGQPLGRPACIVAGGETTVTLRGKGLGGRNQELALGAAPLLAGIPDVALVTLGTDGEDGPTDAAGAIVTGSTIARAEAGGLSHPVFLANNDSYHFFERLGNLIKPGPTGTNVNDLVFLFAF